MSSFFTERVNGAPNARGGVYKAIMHTARQHIEQGRKTGALPDGRCRGEELSKNATPVIGMDRSGVTALIQSAAALRPWEYHESFCVDALFHPSALEGEKGYPAFKGLLMAYLEQGGQSIQFNVFDVETLLDAQKHPESYGNLQVRICGWNALWVNVRKEEQDAYIERAQNAR
jgi:formate C-acetyltransferase